MRRLIQIDKEMLRCIGLVRTWQISRMKAAGLAGAPSLTEVVRAALQAHPAVNKKVYDVPGQMDIADLATPAARPARKKARP